MRSLHHILMTSARRYPNRCAVQGPDDRLTYRGLDDLAASIAAELRSLGVVPGDRVAIWLDKSARAVAAMQGVLRVGAAYVPLDPQSPVERARLIIASCEPAVLISDQRANQLATELGVSQLDWRRVAGESAPPTSAHVGADRDLAYILYTSGSTGVPKGVCISHGNALAFIEWAAAELAPGPEDKFANHAPFHFDLSVLDLYVALSAGATVVLVPEASAYIPEQLVQFVHREQVTIWYSVPSALILMLERGGMAGIARELSALRAILFAGEPFAVKYLRQLRALLPAARLLNLYGPTETNVCTFYEVGEIPAEQTTPVPIGGSCSGDRVWAVDKDGAEIAVGELGELMVQGPTVMLGYWGQQPHGERPYATGDIVRRLGTDCYEYVGRRDHMVKVRGHRVEIGEVEAALLAHQAIAEVAVVVRGTGLHAQLVAFAVAAADRQPDIIAVKRHCAARLPRYMIVDRIRWVSELPRTGTGKIDRRRLAAMADEFSAEGQSCAGASIARPSPGEGLTEVP
jgi:L-proline---[L-prolyl-carrier protein] ligase